MQSVPKLTVLRESDAKEHRRLCLFVSHALKPKRLDGSRRRVRCFLREVELQIHFGLIEVAQCRMPQALILDEDFPQFFKGRKCLAVLPPQKAKVRSIVPALN